MTDLESRIERLEETARFYLWLRVERWLKSLTREQLDAYVASDGSFPEPLPNPPIGSLDLDQLDEKALRKRWEIGRRSLARIREANERGIDEFR